MRHLTFAAHVDGYYVSRCGNDLAWPILDYEKIGRGGDYTKPLEYLDKVPVVRIVGREWQELKWTKKVPTAVKNLHRKFWGLKELKPLPAEKVAGSIVGSVMNLGGQVVRVERGKNRGVLAILPNPEVAKVVQKFAHALQWGVPAIHEDTLSLDAQQNYYLWGIPDPWFSLGEEQDENELAKAYGEHLMNRLKELRKAS